MLAKGVGTKGLTQNLGLVCIQCDGGGSCHKGITKITGKKLTQG
jgi:hypothetical protein